MRTYLGRHGPSPSRALVLSALVAAYSLAPGAGEAATRHRPLSEFLNAQGSTNLFIPPTPDYIAWFNNAPPTPTSLFASVDYSGAAARWIRTSGGTPPPTQLSGSVSERDLADGRTEVTVLLRARSALTWVAAIPGDFALDPPLFGYRAPEILANPGLDPSVSSCLLQVVFRNTAPGAPLPDLVDAFILGNTAPGQELVMLSFRSSGQGTLHANFGVTEGTRGSLVVTQTGLFQTPFQGAVGDAFPAELVLLQALR